jgi:hypothetical protein
LSVDLALVLQKAAARRRRVPAFGEWNYYYHYDEPEAAAAAVAPPAVAYCYGYATPEPEACSDVWFRYSPPPRKPTPTKKKTRRTEGDDASLEKKGRRARPASDAGGGGLGRTTRVVRPVDEDLYQVPPPDLASHRRHSKSKRRSLWMGCLGCVA